MRAPIIALITMYQCATTVNPPYEPSRWSPEERILFLYPNIFFGFMLAVIVVWTVHKIATGKPIIDDLDDMEEENELRRELRRHSRYRHR
jgi:hypothetical protein